MTDKSYKMEVVESKRIFLVDILAVCFGIGAWVSINGLWVELPLMVEVLPEGWSLPSYLTVIIQLANIGPILYAITQKYCGGKINDSLVVYGILLIGCVASLCLAVFWNYTAEMFGTEHSVALFILVFFLSIVDCTSSVLFLPFMAVFETRYLTSYLIGEGLSGFLPSVFALIQGVGGNPECRNVTTNNVIYQLEAYYPQPRFSVNHFFYILFAMMLVSGLSFFFLNVLPSATKGKVSPGQSTVVLLDNNRNNFDERRISSTSESVALHSRVVRLYSTPGNNGAAQVEPVSSSEPTDDVDIVEQNGLSRRLFIYILVLQAWMCVLSNGVFPSIQSYSTLPYSNMVYHLSATLSSMVGPLVCFIAYFLPSTQVKIVSLFTLLGTLISCYIMATAALSPTPPMVGDLAGDALVTCSWILFSGLFTYAKVSIATICRMKGRKALFLCGAVTQLGSAVGSFLIFFLVNSAQLFKSYYPC